MEGTKLISPPFSDASLVVEMNARVQTKGFRKSHVDLMVPGLENRLSIKPAKFVLGFEKNNDNKRQPQVACRWPGTIKRTHTI